MFQQTTNYARKSYQEIRSSFLVDPRLPETWIGRDLDNEEKRIYHEVKNSIERFFSLRTLNHALMVRINDFISTNICPRSSESSCSILQELFKYLRIKLLNNDVVILEHTAMLLDFLVKNYHDFKVHLLVNQRKFMKTMSVIARRHLAKGASHYRSALVLLDCIQGWGEGFYSRRHVYPHIWETYHKLVYKHGIHFPRPYFDPTRVPIFLGPIKEKEVQIIMQYAHQMDKDKDSTEDSHHDFSQEQSFDGDFKDENEEVVEDSRDIPEVNQLNNHSSPGKLTKISSKTSSRTMDLLTGDNNGESLQSQYSNGRFSPQSSHIKDPFEKCFQSDLLADENNIDETTIFIAQLDGSLLTPKKAALSDLSSPVMSEKSFEMPSRPPPAIPESKVSSPMKS